MRRGGTVLERGGNPDQLIPLFLDQRGIDRAMDDVIEAAIMLGAIQLVELLLAHVQPGHQGKAQEVTEAKQLVREAMLVDKMFPGAQDRIVVEQPVEYVDGYLCPTPEDVKSAGDGIRDRAWDAPGGVSR